MLENATVRASAVCAMAKFGMEVESLRPTVTTLLQRCIYDNDDEVRDRAAFFLQAISDKDGEALNRARSITVGGLPFPVANLEESLKGYLKGPTELPFDSSTVSKVEKRANAAKEKKMFSDAEEMEIAAEAKPAGGAPLPFSMEGWTPIKNTEAASSTPAANPLFSGFKFGADGRMVW